MNETAFAPAKGIGATARPNPTAGLPSRPVHEPSYAGLAYCSALSTSMHWNGWLPSTQASWPGGMV